MNKDKSRLVRTAVLVICGVASFVAIGLYGLWLWLALSALVLGSEGFRAWVKSQDGYQSRTAKLPLWGDKSPGRLFVSLTMYLLPLSLAFGFLMLGLIQSGRTFAIFALIGLFGLLLLHIWFVYGNKGLSAKAIGSSIFSSLRFAGDSRLLASLVLAGAFFPLLCGMVTMSMASVPAANEVPAMEMAMADEPSKEELAEGRSGFVAIDYDEESAETATAQATYTPLPTYTPMPTYTPHPTATDAPTETAVPTETREPMPTRTARPTATEVVVEGELATVVSIVDGDTIKVDIDGVVESVRYIGIDAPESDDLCGLEATWANGRLVSGETVRLVRDVNDRDRYDRLLRYVYAGDTFVNAELVKQGWAIPKRYPPDTAMAAVLEAAQTGGPAPSCQAVEAPETAVPVVAEAAAVTPTEAVVAAPTEPLPTEVPVVPTEAPPPTEAPVVPTEAPPTEAPVVPTEPPVQAALPTDVQITGINFDGVVARVESDEYIVITNTGIAVINIGGWHLNAGDAGQDFTFPGFDLAAGQSCRVYTNESHPETCGFSFGSGKAILNNKGDCVYLFDGSGAQIASRCY
ncbi:MAG: lamin tail domain-containing protein [Candidatus Promineifilaceae bacterium]